MRALLASNLLTPCEQRQCDQCTKLRFEALEKGGQGDDVEDHVEEVEMHDWEQIESVHYTQRC
jgi:hypothetical protein